MHYKNPTKVHQTRATYEVIVMKQRFHFRWRKRRILTGNSSSLCFFRSWTKLKSLWMKVIQAFGNMGLSCTRHVLRPHPHCIYFAFITDDIGQVISTNSPESCLSYLTDLEKKGEPHTDINHLARLVDSYTRVFSNMPPGKHCENESYARMLVRFAELKVWVATVDACVSK